MSKSEGNFFTLRDVLAEAPGEAIRLFLLSGHYRSGLDWSPEHELAKQLNKASDEAQQSLLKTQLIESATLIGLLQQEPEEWFRWRAPASESGGLSDEQIEAMIQQRLDARTNKDFVMVLLLI